VSVYPADPRPRALVRANVGKAAGVSAAALAIMVAFTAPREGEVRHTYVDHMGKGGAVLSYCFGETAGAVAGKTYTHAECLAQLKVSALKHAQEVQKCLPPGLPDDMAVSFYDAGYNLGAPRFCSSPMSRLALKGDLRGACDALLLYKRSNGKDCSHPGSGCRGVWLRRQDEHALCLQGLKDGR
jgi:lysozyme